jgi:hypothetical protein
MVVEVVGEDSFANEEGGVLAFVFACGFGEREADLGESGEAAVLGVLHFGLGGLSHGVR